MMTFRTRNPGHVAALRMLFAKSSSSSLLLKTTSQLSAKTSICLTLPSLLLLFMLMFLSQPAACNAVDLQLSTNETLQTRCVVVVEDTEIVKEIGSVWVSSENPCAIHSCEASGVGGLAQEKISNTDCGQFYCEVDSELRPDEATCCGTCVRTKCLFNGTAYEVGQSWHSNNNCTLRECTQPSIGPPIINAYRKSCPALPPDCAEENIVEVDCCPTCQGSSADTPEVVVTGDIWTEQFYRNHPCARECRFGEPPQTCRYTFVVELYETLSKACFECPQNATDCERPHCVVGDGIRRSITVVNRMMPGPAIEVCLNDQIVVDVKNRLMGESTTIHWHGMHQRDTPYMDGVPHVSQCPISPHATFRYTFRAENAGSHFWHSHTGMQRGDGVFGAFIVRRPKVLEPHGRLYDFDLSEHTMVVQDWVHVPGIVMFSAHHHSRGDNKPMNLLVNGKGRYYKAIWEAIKREDQIKQRRLNEATTEKQLLEDDEKEAATEERTTEMTTTASEEMSTQQTNAATESVTSNLVDEIASLYAPEKAEVKKMNSQHVNEISRLLRRLSSDNNETFKNSTSKSRILTKISRDTASSVNSSFEATQQSINNSTINNTSGSRAKRDTRADKADVALDQVPLHIFNVSHGFRYRFRIINAEFLNCPIKVSIDNHSLMAISSDGYDFEPAEVGSIVTYAGERFDFVVHANQTPGNYWVRFKGLMDCSERFTSAFQVAILHYEGSAAAEPEGELSYQHQAKGIELNVMNRGPGYVDSLTIAELSGLQLYDSVPGVDLDALKPVADYKFFVYYDFYAKDNPVFHPAGYYGFNETVSGTSRLFTPQLNHISLKFPSVALLPSRNQLDDSMFCNETSLAAAGIDCRKEFCRCHHMLQVPLNSVVELIIVDEGFTFDANHPFHLHGNAFRVVGLERLGKNVTIEMVKQLDRYNLLKRNLRRAPIKDTVTVPDGGYTIVRFEASNPGFWLFHCHIEFHAEIGMALVLKVGNNDEMLPVPKNFPTCNDYMPDMMVDEDANDSHTKDEDADADADVIATISTQQTSSNGSRLRNAVDKIVQILMLFRAILSIRLR